MKKKRINSNEVLIWTLLGIFLFGTMCMELYPSFTIIHMNLYGAACVLLVAVTKAFLRRKSKRKKVRIPKTRVDATVTETLPTYSELIEAGRDPEEVGLMLADGKARKD